MSAVDAAGAVVGTWDVTIRTPLGTIPVVLRFVSADGGVEGTAASGGEESRLQDIGLERGTDGVRIRWRQSVRKPLRLNLDFDVIVTGDALSGVSRAGRLPASAVEGRRVGAQDRG